MGRLLTSADLEAMAEEAEIAPGSHLQGRKEEEREGRIGVRMFRKGPPH